MTDDAEMLERCRGYAEQQIPELRDATFYIVGNGVLDNEPWFSVGGPVGWCAQATDISQVAPGCLGDEWAGPGPMIYLNMKWLRDHAFKGYFEKSVLTVLTHELGHLAFPLMLPTVHSARVNEYIGQLQLAALTYNFDGENLPAPAADQSHDWKWIRRTIHIYVRAAANGHVFGIDRLLHSGDCQFDAKKYVPILLAEALRMRNEPMEAINALPEDPWLVGTYQDDVDEFMDEIASEEGGTDDAE